MGWLKAALGIVVIGFTVKQIFKDLFHPTMSGALSEWIGAGLFRAGRRWPALLPSAGPLAVAAVIVTWALLQVFGFALIYWAVFPQDFTFKTDSRPAGYDDFWWCVYYSFEMLTTLGLGDILPNPNLVRLAAASLDEALRLLSETIGERLSLRDRSMDSVLPAFAKLHSAASR